MTGRVVLERLPRRCPGCGASQTPWTSNAGTRLRTNCRWRTCRIARTWALAGATRPRSFEHLPLDDRHVHRAPR